MCFVRKHELNFDKYLFVFALLKGKVALLSGFSVSHLEQNKKLLKKIKKQGEKKCKNLNRYY